MNDIADTLWLLWWCYYVSGALVGSFLGTLLAWAVRGIVRRIIKWYRKGEEA